MALRTLTLSTLLCTASALAAHAGGLERTIFNVSPLYEDGRYLEFSAGIVLPDLEGDEGFVSPLFGGPLPLTGSTGDILDNYLLFGAAYKADINDKLSYALILDQPLGADTDYPAASAPLPDATAVYGGSFADLDSLALTALLAYDATERVKVYGGPIFQTIEASAALPFIPAGPAGSGYEVDADRSYGIGFAVGASYQIPEIALRVGLTYRSAIDHDIDTTETLGGGVVSFNSETEIETPQSLTLDFQTGIAKDTLLFGQVHWVDWSEFDISPPNYPPLALGRPLVSYTDDWITYTLGVGRQFNDNWAGSVAFTYEPQTDQELTSLGPVDGRMGVTIGARYENDRMKISGGVSYSRLGDARNVLNTDYNDGDAIGIGIKVGFKL